MATSLIADHTLVRHDDTTYPFIDQDVTLTPTQLTVAGANYPNDQLVSVHLHAVRPEKEHLVLLYGMGVGLVPLGLLALGWWLALCGLILFAVGMWLQTQLRPTYQVLIGLANGVCLTLASHDRKLCRDLVRSIRPFVTANDAKRI